MNQSAPTLPTSHRDTRGHACVKSLMGIKRRTGVTMPKHLLLKMAFDAGYEAGAEDAGSGELLTEVKALQWRSATWTPRQGGVLRWTKSGRRSGESGR